MDSDPIIELPSFLAILKTNPKNLRLIDCAYFPPKDPRNSLSEHLAATLQGSIFFPIDEIADTKIPLPHMMPPQAVFLDFCKKNKIRKNDTIIFFDHLGCFSSPRVWFTFKCFGAENIKILNAGIKTLKESGLTVKGGKPNLSENLDEDNEKSYEYKFEESRIINLKQIYDSIKPLLNGTSEYILYDTRPADRFDGKAPDPRAGVRKGNIPGSKNIPFTEILDMPNGKMKNIEELRNVLEKRGVDLKTKKKIIASCGSGLTACILIFALFRVGIKDVYLYDGSWSEYGSLPEPKWEF